MTSQGVIKILKVTEKDLFIYIFYPDKLSENTFKYINKNTEKFHSELELLSDMKANMNSPLPGEVSSKIMSEIESYEGKQEIFLYKSKETQPSEFLLEASSGEDPNALTETFQDENKLILVKIVSQKKKSKIYFFSKNTDKELPVYLRFYPSFKTFLVNLDAPLVIDRIINISKIGFITALIFNLFLFLSDFSISFYYL